MTNLNVQNSEEHNTDTSTEINLDNLSNNENIEMDNETKNMTKAEKKVYDLRKKLELANKELEEEQELEKQKNQQEIIKLLNKKNLDSVSISVWKKNIDAIIELLKS